MVPLAEFLELAADDREGKFPFVWAVDRKNQLARLLVDRIMVESCRGAARLLDDAARARRSRCAGGLARAGRGRGAPGGRRAHRQRPDEPRRRGRRRRRSLAALAAPAPAGGAAAVADGDYLAPWLESDKCTACDECTNLNPKMFAYGPGKKAFIKDANAGPYSDLVKASERCTAGVIHPGLPRDRSGKDADKWIARGRKHN